MATTIDFLQKSTNGTPVTNLEDSQIVDAGGAIKFRNTLDVQNAGADDAIQIKNEGTAAYTSQIATTDTGVELRSGSASRDYSILTGALPGTVRMLFKASNGRIGIKTAAPAHDLEVAGTFGVTGNVTIPLVIGNTVSTGNITALDCFATSDETLKKNVQPKAFDREKVLKLAALVSTFTWKEDDREDFGLIAQEVEKIYPELVNTDPNTGLKSVNYAKISLLVLQMVASMI